MPFLASGRQAAEALSAEMLAAQHRVPAGLQLRGGLSQKSERVLVIRRLKWRRGLFLGVACGMQMAR